MISGVSHIGVRVLDSARAEAFYGKLGFETKWRSPTQGVVILKNAADVEINLIVNADAAYDGNNVLMEDGAPKRAGYTHVAFRVASIEDTIRKLAELDIAISGGPERLGAGTSLFVRDPDNNVIELREEPVGTGGG
jgi:lactoylglutathione lyase